MKLKLTSLFLYLFTGLAWSTTYAPVPIEDRMRNSDGVIIASHLGQSYKKVGSGRVVTEHTLQVEELSGLAPNDVVNKNAFKIVVPGGVWNGLHYKVGGTPDFSPNEKIVLMVKKGPYGFVLPDLSLSKFNIIEKSGEKYLASEVFGDVEGVGRLSYESFRTLVHDIYGEELKSSENDKFVYKGKKKQRRGRSLASEEDEQGVAQEKKSLNLFWLVLIFASLGLFGIFRARSEGE